MEQSEIDKKPHRAAIEAGTTHDAQIVVRLNSMTINEQVQQSEGCAQKASTGTQESKRNTQEHGQGNILNEEKDLLVKKKNNHNTREKDLNRNKKVKPVQAG